MSNTFFLFVYGSLKCGECNDHVVKPWLLNSTVASTSGRLYLRSDDYPALYLENFGRLGSSDYGSDLKLVDAPSCQEGQFVRGELLELSEGFVAIPALDEFEGYFPNSDSEYLRVSLEVETEDGPRVCWTYIGANSPPSVWPRIEDWPPPGIEKKPEPYRHGY